MRFTAKYVEGKRKRAFYSSGGAPSKKYSRVLQIERRRTENNSSAINKESL